MKLLILTLCVAGALARPDVSHILKEAKNDREAQILKQSLDLDPNGKYYWELETNNGINAHEHGEQKQIDRDTSANLVGGKAGWISPEGETVQLSYTADENGYRPEGSHIPTPPPIPEAILRALKWIADHPPAPEPQYRQ
ncbi:hypothetical protein O0L34_g16026 [Tuta absoluta]|nr:hypothetical protein O0L34_g16026 [Tuta absoluta]